MRKLREWVVVFREKRVQFSSLVVLAITSSILTPLPASSADLSQFQAGNIISDSVFFNGSGLSSGEVQAFLDSKVPTCTINNGQDSHAAGAAYGSTQIATDCLRSYRQPTPTMSAQQGLCSRYEGSNSESAATIITKVGQVCGVNPKVLLVLLEKEQSLVTDTWPTVKQFTSATGFACYDNGEPCVSDFDGFFFQVWAAAKQFRTYGSGTFTWYPVGQTSSIAYQADNLNTPEKNENIWCGRKSVQIENRATAALYYYTPYTPNAAALAAGYGLGDECSAYGNRNFYQLFVDWFGSTQGFEIGTYFSEYAAANSAWLGHPTSPMVCNGPDGGCSQSFANALVTSSGHSYAAGVKNIYLPAWGNYGREWGVLGYPKRDETLSQWGDIVRQEFQGGWIVNSNGAYRVVLNKVLETWNNWGRQTGILGMPSSGQWCEESQCFQTFQGGTIITGTPTGSRVLTNSVWNLWKNWGRQFGILGFPTTNPSSPGSSNYTQNFQGGTVTVTNNIATLTSVTDPWFNAVLSNSSWLGSATNSKSCTLGFGGCYQSFQGGWVVSSSQGTFPVRNEVRTLWSNWGREYGILGFPTGSPSAANGRTYTQNFQGGTVTVTNNIATLTSVTDPWFNAVLSNSSWLGSATNSKSCTLGFGGCYQSFQGGWVVSSSQGTFPVRNEVRTLWSNWGREYGILGFPTGSPSAANGGTYTQNFQGGTVTVTNNIATLTSVTDPWFNAVLSNSSWLGSATNSKSCTLGFGGCYQSFQGGWVVSSSQGTFPVRNEVRTLWSNWGREYGILGFPTGSPSAANGGTYTQNFQGGTVTVTNNIATLTSVTDPWFNAVLSNSSWLGSATNSKSCTLGFGGCYQSFQGGWVVSSSQGTFPVRNEVRTLWSNWGREYGILGFPTGSPSAANGGTYTQNFQGGTVTVTNNIATLTSVTDPWFNAVLSNSSWLGSATNSKSCTLGFGGCYQSFQGGWVVSSSQGTFPVRNEVRTLWSNWGREYGILGFPTGSPSAANGGTYTQNFQGGTVTVTNNIASFPRG